MHSLNHFRIVSLARVIQPRTEHLVRLLSCHLAFTNELSTAIDVLSAIFDSFENAVGLLFSIANVDNDSENLKRARKMVYDRGGKMVLGGDDVGNVKFIISYNGPQEIDHLFQMNREHGKINQRKRKDAGYTYEQFGEYMIYNVSSEESRLNAIFGVMEIDA